MVACQEYSDFDAMVIDMSSKEVPLIHPDSIPAGVILLDVRPDEEYDVSHIPGAWTLEKFESVEIPTDTPIVVYCSVGYRSGKYGEKLLDGGRTEVYNLYGGIFKWHNEGREIVMELGPTERIHTYNKKWGEWVTRGEKVH